MRCVLSSAPVNFRSCPKACSSIGSYCCVLLSNGPPIVCSCAVLYISMPLCDVRTFTINTRDLGLHIFSGSETVAHTYHSSTAVSYSSSAAVVDPYCCCGSCGIHTASDFDRFRACHPQIMRQVREALITSEHRFHPCPSQASPAPTVPASQRC